MTKKPYWTPKIRFVNRNQGNLASQLALFGYDKVWQSDGQRIAKIFHELTGLRFWYKRITALVVLSATSNAGSRYKRMKLSVYEHDHRERILTHELGHRLLYGNWLGSLGKTHRYWDHYKLYLFLYDAWVYLYGAEIANRLTEREKRSNHHSYRKALERVLAMSFAQRQAKLKKMISRVPKKYIS